MKTILTSMLAWLGAVCLSPGASAAEPAPAPAATPQWEGAMGLIANHEASYAGSGEMVSRFTPALFLRYGRYMVTNAGVFVTRSRDDVMRGASADLLRSDSLRLNLALRLDNGRSESKSGKLQGLGDVRRTLRGRLSMAWVPAPAWRLVAGLSPDLLGRGGGTTFDLGLGRDFSFGAAGVLGLGASALWADRTYMQVRYGVTPEQAARSGYPATALGGGRVSMGLHAQWRRDFGPRWTGFAGASSGHYAPLLLRSPLVASDNGWSVSAGLAWRF